MRPTVKRLMVYVVTVFAVSYALQAAIWLEAASTRRPSCGWPPSSCSCRGWPPSRSCGDAHEAGGRSRGASDSPHVALGQRGVVVSRGLFVLGRGEQSIPFFLLNVTLSGGARQSERTRDGGRGGWLARIPAARAALANELSSSDNHRRARLGALAHAGNPDGLPLSRDPERDEVARTSPP